MSTLTQPLRNGMAIRNPKGGKAHRARPTSFLFIEGQLIYGTQCRWNSRSCTEVVPLAQTAEEDRCQRCWGATS